LKSLIEGRGKDKGIEEIEDQGDSRREERRKREPNSKIDSKIALVEIINRTEDILSWSRDLWLMSPLRTYS
jgi:hypothetical protein